MNLTSTRATARQQPRCVPARRGFVLIVVLALLTVAALMTAGLARRSLSLAQSSLEAERRLQSKWTELSLQRVVLSRAESILAAQIPPDSDDEIRHTHRETLELNGIDYALVIADEDAKVNLNAVYYANGEEGVARTAQEMQAATFRIPVRLRPYQATKQQLPVFDSWGQIFDASRFTSKATADSLIAATDGITCWGSGRLNIRRAPDDALRSIARLHASGGVADEIVRRRQEHPTADLDQLLNGLELNVEERAALESALADQSRCHSLWVQSIEGGGSRSALYVAESNERGRIYVSVFAW